VSEPGSSVTPWFSAFDGDAAIRTVPPLDGLQPALDKLMRGVKAFFVRLERQWRLAQRDHRRRARLEAYRCRKAWGTADVPHLMALGVSKPAQMRLQRILANGKPGRGVVKVYKPLDIVIDRWVKLFQELECPETSPLRRLTLLKVTPWWRYVIEGLYRSEYDLARMAGRKSPAECAESVVADRLLISAAVVHKLCGRVRRERRAGVEAADNPPLRMDDFAAWLQAGGDLWPEFQDDELACDCFRQVPADGLVAV
jgi:hypothetical protein